jgi:hypothetical protein
LASDLREKSDELQDALYSAFFGASSVVGQVAGSGTTNTIPQFTSPTTIADSEIVQFNGNVGINSPTPNAKLEVKDFRKFDSNGQGPSAILGVVTCQPVPKIARAGVRGDANEISLGATGVIGNQFNLNGGGGRVLGQTFGSGSFTYGTTGESFATSGVGAT